MSEYDGKATIPLRDEDEDALSKPSLVSSVANMLKEIGGEPAEDELNAAPTHEDDDDQIIEDEDEGDLDADDDGEDGQPTPVADKDEDEDEEFELPEIPDAYYRSAARVGWTPESIKEMTDQIGVEKVTTMLSNIHQSDNNLTMQFSALGRKAKEMDAPAPNVIGDAPAADGGLPEIDIEAIKEKYGEDDPLVLMYAQQGQALKKMQEALTGMSAKLDLTQTRVSQQEQDANDNLLKSVNGFFGGKGMEPYGKFYGGVDEKTNTWDNLSMAQTANRDMVCKLADQILVGARMHNDPMTLEDAMERAHLVVSEPIAESIVRTKIMKSVKRRSKSRVVRPSKGAKTSKTSSTGKPKNRAELVEKTNERLNTLFKGLRN